MGTNHFITVSTQGVLMARRKGQSPFAVTTAAEGLSVSTERPSLPTIRVFFEHGGGNRMRHVLTVGVGEQRVPIETFQSEHAVTDEELGRWIRMAIERVLDANPR
jgi:hypothetical protein